MSQPISSDAPRMQLTPWQLQQPVPAATTVDRLLLTVGVLVALWLVVVVAVTGLHSRYAPVVLVIVWALTAYVALPRINKVLSDIYTPDYFIGRTRTGDGVLGDPVNLGVDGSAEQLDHAMRRAGWSRADPITLGSALRIIGGTVLRRSYDTAPVSSLFLFGRRQDVAYQQQVDGNPKQRHHVRFWHCPEGWLLPGGARCDWLAGASFDRNVGLSLFTLQVTHKIDADTDIERDHVVTSLTSALPAATVRVLEHQTSSYHARNGGGDRFVTDGNLPVVDLGRVTVDAPPPLSASTTVADEVPIDTEGAALLRAPFAVVAGVVAVLLGALLEAFRLGASRGGLFVMAAVVAVHVVLAWFVLRGGRAWARLGLVGLLTVSVVGLGVELITDWAHTGLRAGNNDPLLVGMALASLAIIALSAEPVGAWCRAHRSAVRASPSGHVSATTA